MLPSRHCHCHTVRAAIPHSVFRAFFDRAAPPMPSPLHLHVGRFVKRCFLHVHSRVTSEWRMTRDIRGPSTTINKGSFCGTFLPGSAGLGRVGRPFRPFRSFARAAYFPLTGEDVFASPAGPDTAAGVLQEFSRRGRHTQGVVPPRAVHFCREVHCSLASGGHAELYRICLRHLPPPSLSGAACDWLRRQVAAN